MAAATNDNSGPAAVIGGSPDSAARQHLLAAVAFLAIGAVFALLAAVKLAFPEVFDQTSFAGYARLRPIAFNMLVHGFGFMFVSAAAYYVVPRLTGRPIPFEPAARFNVLVAGGAVLVGSLLVAAGVNSGGDLAEFPLWIDVIFFASTLVPASIVTVAVVTRRENTLYPALAFVTAAALVYPGST